MNEGKEVFNPHADYPHYQKGDFQLFVDKVLSNGQNIKKIVLVVHHSGHGTVDELNLQETEIRELVYEISIIVC